VEQNMTVEAKQRSNVAEIDFTAIFAILWRHWKLIFFGTLAMTLLAAALSFFIPKTYRSEGFYQLGNPERKIVVEKDKEKEKEKENLIGIPIPLYKKSAPQFFNPNRFYQSASEWKSFSEKDLNKVKTSFQTATDINKWIQPMYAFSKGDMRELAQVPIGESNSVIGLYLSYEADSPQKAYSYVRFFGQYIRDCLLYVSLYEYVKDDYSKVISELSENENNIIDMQFNVLQNTKKMLDIKAILTKYPASAKIENRQLVSVQEGGSRFLSPVTQLVGIESALADQRRNLAELEREKDMLLIRREYFSKCNNSLNKLGRRGEMIFSQLKVIKSDVFKNKDFRMGTVKEVFNNLNIALQTFDLAFFTNCRFISGPTLPERHIAPRKSIIVIVACFLSFFFFVFLVFALHWWQSNKKAIKSFREE
jgi:LPS O-antigen subunit length determinant protein (WzzB/FepE family)